MALQIEKVLSNRFELSLDGGVNVVSSSSNELFTTNELCDFKTGTGANIIKKQNIPFTDVTVIDTYGGTGTFTFTTIESLWTKLTELDFFGITGAGGGITTFAGLNDTDAYFGNDGKVPIVNESQQKLDYSVFYNINQLIQLDDVSINALIDGKILGITLIRGVPKVTLIDKPADGTTYFSAVGGFDYDDEITGTTPLAYTSGNLQLTNDTLGANTFLTQPPYGVTSVWNEATNAFDFSELSEGDEVFLRVNIDHTTSTANQITKMFLQFQEGAINFNIAVDENIQDKSSGLHNITRTIHFYVRDAWKNNPVYLYYNSDASSSINVNGWHPYIIRKSINVLDVNDDNFRTFTVDEVSAPVTGETTNEGTVKVSYNGTSNKITNIIFDKTFTKYLGGFSSVISLKNLEFKIFNKTKGITLISNVVSFSYTNVNNEHYSVSMEDLITYTAVDVGDKLEVNIDVTSSASSASDLSEKEQFTATAGQTVFNLSTTPNNVDVYVNRAYQDNGDFTYLVGTVTMDYSLDAGDIVEIRKFSGASIKEFFTATAGQTSIALSTSPSNVDVIINRVPQIETIDYTLSNNVITLINSADENDIIEVRKYN